MRARATLVRGTSSGSVWEVDASQPQARVMLGSAITAGWVLTGPGIQPFHVELYWDGMTLYVSDPQGAGDVRLNGQLIAGWTPVRGRAQLVFGRAIVSLETDESDTGEVETGPAIEADATRVAAPPSSRVADLGPSPTVAGPPPAIAQALPFGASPPGLGAAAPIAPQGRSAGMGAAPPFAAPSAGPFGATGPMAATPMLGPAPFAVSGAAPAPATSHATVMLLDAGLPAERPRLGGVTGAHGALAQDATRMVDSAAISQRRPPVEAAPPPIVGPPPAMPIGAPPSPPAGGPAFAPPPTFEAASTAATTSKPSRVRPLLLLLLTVVVALIAARMALPHLLGRRRAVSRPTAAVVDAGVPDAAPAIVWRNPSTFAPVLTAETPDGGIAITPDSIANQLVREGRFADALAQYTALRDAHPERPEYRIMCEVLERQLRAACVDGRRWDGSSCVR